MQLKIAMYIFISAYFSCLSAAYGLPAVEELEKRPVVLAQPVDFGFPDEEIFGPPYYSWPMKTHEPNAQYNIIYVVYRYHSLDKVKQYYKINPEAEMDYRYILYEDAITLLEKKISEESEWISKHTAKPSYVGNETMCLNSVLFDSYNTLSTYYRTSYYIMKYLGVGSLQ